MTRIERLAAILLLLQERPHTAGEIARKYEISRRTVLRDVQALCEMGVPVIAKEGPGGGYSLPPEFRTEPLPLNRNEAFLLLLAIGAIENLSALPFHDEYVSLSAKLRALLPQSELASAGRLLRGVQPPAVQEIPAPFLEALLALVQEGRWVRVTYQSSERVSTQHLLPERVYPEQGLWYLRAYSHEHQATRTYRVDRIQAMEMPVKDFQPNITAHSLPYDHISHPEIIVRLTPKGASRIESQPQLAQRMTRGPNGEGRLALRCPPSELDWYAGIIAALGEEAEVESPPELQEKLRSLGRKLLERYAKW